MSPKRVSPKVASLLTLLLLAVPTHSLGADGHCAHHKQEPSATAPAAAAPSAPTPATEVRLVDTGLLDQSGAQVRFKSDVLADKIVVMDFVFTTCTTVCPVLSAIFGRVQGRLGERLEKEVRMVSISVDPTRDTPARLKAYSDSHRAKTGWTWLTGSPESVKQVLEGLGAYTANSANHTPMVLVGDVRTGRWVRLNGFPSEEQILAKVDELAAARRGATSVAAERN